MLFIPVSVARHRPRQCAEPLRITYHQLGIVAQRQNRLGEADKRYRAALAIEKQIGDLPRMASTYHQLGVVARHRGWAKAAEKWLRQALLIREGVDPPGMTETYHELGMVAQDQGRLDEAEQWYRKALAIAQGIRNRPYMAAIYGQLGILAADRGQLPEALAWTITSVALFDEFPDPAMGPGPGNLVRFTELLGMAALEDTWRPVTGDKLPRNVHDYVEARI